MSYLLSSVKLTLGSGGLALLDVYKRQCLTQFEVEDVTDMARAAVRYVATRPMRFGKSLIADVLHGGNTERIRACLKSILMNSLLVSVKCLA